MNIVILGAGDNSREAYFHLLDQYGDNLNVIFADDNKSLTSLTLQGKELPVISNWKFPKDFTQFLVGVAQPKIKKIVVAKAISAGLTPAETFIHPKAIVQHLASLGKGGIIAPGAIITINITIGDYVFINYGTTIGHDTVLKDYVSIYPGANISGKVNLSEGVLVGAGAAIKEGISIAQWCTIGMKSAVIRDVDEPHRILSGVPAKYHQ